MGRRQSAGAKMCLIHLRHTALTRRSGNLTLEVPGMPTALRERPKPFLLPEFCKGCGRCIDACAKDCIGPGREIDPRHGPRPCHAESRGLQRLRSVLRRVSGAVTA